MQLGEGNHSQEEEERVQPGPHDVAPSVDSCCAALKKFSFGSDVCQTVGKSYLWERGEEWGAEEQVVMEEVSLERLREA